MSEYKRIDELNIPIIRSGSLCGVRAEDIHPALKAKYGDHAPAQFDDLFGCQTCPMIDGEYALYPWDVEAVLERMATGRLTGTQAWMD